MVAAVQAGAASTVPAATDSVGGTVPFFYGSNLYAQKFGSPDPVQLGTSTQEFTYNVIPGGFLRGVRLQIRSTGGAGGTAGADAPWSVLSSVKLENVDGSEIMKAMNGYSYYLGQRFFRPWHGDPATRHDFAAGPNPSCSLFIQPEIRHTAGVLANTDARSQYRITYSIAKSTDVFSEAPTTPPTVSVTKYAEIWAQPDATDAHGNEIQALPPGLNLATVRRHQILPMNSAGADNTWQLSLTGNEIRGLILVTRDGSGQRVDGLGDPVRWNIDNRNLGVFSPDEIFDHMADFYPDLSSGTSTRPVGVYVFPRFFQPGRMVGQAWLATTNATYLVWEATTAQGVSGTGTLQIIADEVVPVGPVPAELESI